MKRQYLALRAFAFTIFCTTVLGCSHAPEETPADQIFDYSSSAGANLMFIKRRIDFGKVNNDTVLTARFDFVNTGTEDLTIHNVLPDCTCSSSRISNKTVAPKDSAYIILKVDTEHKSGKVKVYSTVYTNTPTRLYNLEIVADVYDLNKVTNASVRDKVKGK